jgi:DNA-binding GntR family transcriptional regulator
MFMMRGLIRAWASAAWLRSRRIEHLGDVEMGSVRNLAMKYSEANAIFHLYILELSKCIHLKDITDGLFLHMYAVRCRTMEDDNRAKYLVVDLMETCKHLMQNLAKVCARADDEAPWSHLTQLA